jgi:hypothetical protein
MWYDVFMESNLVKPTEFGPFDPQRIGSISEEDIDCFNREVTCAIECPAGTEMIGITDEEWEKIEAEHQRLARTLDTDEVAAIIGRSPYRELPQDKRT